jgi:hypothetical protein
VLLQGESQATHTLPTSPHYLPDFARRRVVDILRMAEPELSAHKSGIVLALETGDLEKVVSLVKHCVQMEVWQLILRLPFIFAQLNTIIPV